jgi:hypothetical protein
MAPADPDLALQASFDPPAAAKDATAGSCCTRFIDPLGTMLLAKGRIEELASTGGIGNVDSESF